MIGALLFGVWNRAPDSKPPHELQPRLGVVGPYQGWTSESIQGPFFALEQSPYVGSMSCLALREMLTVAHTSQGV